VRTLAQRVLPRMTLPATPVALPRGEGH